MSIVRTILKIVLRFVWSWPLTLVYDVKVPDALDKSEHDLLMELLLQLLQGEEVVGVAESLAAQDEGGVVELKQTPQSLDDVECRLTFIT